MRNFLKPSKVAVGLAAMALAVTACGSGSGSVGTGGGDKSAAKALVAKASGDVAWNAPGDPVDVTKYAGKTIWVITSDYSVPFIQSVVASMKEAAQVAGMKLQVFDGKGVTQTAANGIQQAVGANAAAIEVLSVNTQFVAQAIKNANDAKIPVIGLLNTDPSQPVEKGADAEVTIDYALSGKELVAYAVANTDGPVNGFFLTLPSIATFDAMKQGIKDGFKEFCSSKCKLHIADLTEGNFKNETQSNTASALLRYPDTNWVFPAIDAMAQFAIPSITTAGKSKDVRLGSINAFQANLKFITDKNVQVVDVGNSNSWLGWAAIDRALRAMSGAQPDVVTVPVRLFDNDNLKGVDITDESQLFPGVDFRTNYKKLWGLS
jgi:ribose transport system substrate-binding protein